MTLTLTLTLTVTLTVTLTLTLTLTLTPTLTLGAAWLTAAMRAAGSLADSCSVRRIAALYELPLAGDDAQACTLTPNPTP